MSAITFAIKMGPHRDTVGARRESAPLATHGRLAGSQAGRALHGRGGL